jgi:hypothetical protein
MLVVQFHPKHGARQNGDNTAFDFDVLFFARVRHRDI